MGQTSPKSFAVDWPDHYARTQPSKVALQNLETGETRTWKQLDAQTARIANVLQHELRLPVGARVAMLMNNDLRHYEIQFACARTGLALAPLNLRLTCSELVSLCGDLRPDLLVADKTWLKLASEVALEASIPRLVSLADLEQMAERSVPTPAPHDLDGDAPFLILYTSGSTGKPKAAIITLNGVIWQGINQAQFGAIGDNAAHVFNPMPLFHAGGLNVFCNPALYFGGKVTTQARFDPDEAVRFIGDPANGVTHIGLPAVMYQMMADSPSFAKADFSAFRKLLFAGSQLPDRLRETYAAKGVNFLIQYGGTETGPTITSLDTSRLDKVREGSCGQKVMNIHIRLVDAAGRDVQRGEPGEVCVKGPAVIQRYLDRDPALDFVDGWFRTGDVAREDDEGFFYIVDRIKEMYKSGGENVYPAEVERVLMRHPGVADVAVVGVGDDKWGEVGLAVIVAMPGHTVTLESLRTACEGHLARYKHPHHLRVIEEMPRTGIGKIAKPQLRALFASRQLDGSAVG
ncbi:AMP-binding protein [Terricaulis silvestris]|uniref:3-methylmercaptopropionyl-CoA ligase n=1 Tax=Terricaulis silvestris TaxID=2686094 RepID=A0A6I6MH89_9CAUL|nr:AMP-binding protein [Terricaulis silvestris]QGZ93749.1 Long-chain-fatty-acid--CoA ligase FadD13 [Terricaulis silvestris]